METHRTSPLTRRGMLCSAAAGAVVLALTGKLNAAPGDVDALIKDMVGDKEAMADDRLTLDLPEIAENGNTVPLEVAVDSPMTDDDYVKAVHVFATENPNPEVVTFKFSPQSGRAVASTRMRLAKTQDVVAVAELSDGSVLRAAREVKVTIGGCGG
jgi:sulfur-oxidizing protein SoxY